VCALVGGVGYLVLSIAHGNSPSSSGEPAYATFSAVLAGQVWLVVLGLLLWRRADAVTPATRHL
jgi:hypothetical protein